MVKVNLKTASPIKTTAATEEKTEAQAPTAPASTILDESIDLSFDSTESLVPRSDKQIEESAAEPFVSELKEEEKSESTVLSSSREYSEEETFSFSGNGKKGMFIGFTVGIIGLVIVLILILTSGKKQAVPEKPVAEVKAKTETETQPSKPDPEILSIFQENLAYNQFIVTQLQEMIQRRPKTTKIALMVVTPKEIDLTVLADSREKIAQFHLALKHNFPKLPFRILSVQDKFENDKTQYYADFSAKVMPSRIPPHNQSINITVQPQNIEAELKQLAENNHITVAKLKRGKVISQAKYNLIRYYLHLNGTRENLIRFLSDMIQHYPMIRINKATLFFYNLASISDKNLSSRISFTFYNIK